MYTGIRNSMGLRSWGVGNDDIYWYRIMTSISFG